MGAVRDALLLIFISDDPAVRIADGNAGPPCSSRSAADGKATAMAVKNPMGTAAPNHAGSFVPAALGGPFLWPRPGVETEICPNLMTLEITLIPLV